MSPIMRRETAAKSRALETIDRSALWVLPLSALFAVLGLLLLRAGS